MGCRGTLCVRPITEFRFRVAHELLIVSTHILGIFLLCLDACLFEFMHARVVSTTRGELGFCIVSCACSEFREYYVRKHFFILFSMHSGPIDHSLPHAHLTSSRHVRTSLTFHTHTHTHTYTLHLLSFSRSLSFSLSLSLASSRPQLARAKRAGRYVWD
jgi:hypothetical protein